MTKCCRRALLFVHDGTSLGHLQRISRIAGALQGDFACLIVTGMREAHRMAPSTCEVLTLPRWDGLLETRAQRSGRTLWWDEPKEVGIRLRSELISSVVASFDPHLVIVDYLPFGQYGELKGALAASRATKYLVLRGVLDTSDLSVLGGDATEVIASTFDRIVLAIDRRVLDVAEAYQFTPTAEAKSTYVGYVAPSASCIDSVRTRFKLSRGQQWVVCSAGGGRNAGSFILRCVGISQLFPDVRFDIIKGPMSDLRKEKLADLPPNCTVHDYHDDLGELNGAADVVVCGGGYNSLCEAMAGGSRIVIHPNQTADCDEQRVHAALLGRHYPIEFATDPDGIPTCVARALRSARKEGRAPLTLDLTGAQELLRIAKSDVGVNGTARLR